MVRLIRATLRFADRQDREAMVRDLKPVSPPQACGAPTAPHAAAAEARFADFAERWADKYPAAVRCWRTAWTEFIPFLDYDVEIRKVICTTSAIESINARYRRAVRARGRLPQRLRHHLRRQNHRRGLTTA